MICPHCNTENENQGNGIITCKNCSQNFIREMIQEPAKEDPSIPKPIRFHLPEDHLTKEELIDRLTEVKSNYVLLNRKNDEINNQLANFTTQNKTLTELLMMSNETIKKKESEIKMLKSTLEGNIKILDNNTEILNKFTKSKKHDSTGTIVVAIFVIFSICLNGILVFFG